MQRWHVYILRCSDNSLYIGHSHDLDQRRVTHNEGNGPLYTRKRRPVEIVYREEYKSQPEAIKREKQIKRWTRAKKEALISGDRVTLKTLSKRKSKLMGEQAHNSN